MTGDGGEGAYAAAGVDIELGNRVKRGLFAKVRKTFGPEVLGKAGGFGGLFRAEFGGLQEPVLVSSIDGVGTKLKIAIAANSHRSVAQDLVNHCINDVAVVGARPLFFLDYIGAQILQPTVFAQLIDGFTKACRAGGCALIGGETAQLPDIYAKGEYDLAGCIVGVVDRPAILDGSGIVPSDVLVGLPSNGLHTNGYSLARQVLFKQMRLDPKRRVEGFRRSLEEELLRVHRNYQPLLASLGPGRLKGAAHITGGGLVDNLPRILPKNCDAQVQLSSWKVPPIFRLVQEGGSVPVREMYQVFNMGIGLVLVVSPEHRQEVVARAKGKVIGQVIAGTGRVVLV